MERGLPTNKLVPKLRAAVNEYRVLLPVITALRNKAMKERHWVKVSAAMGTSLERDDTFTLQVCPATGCDVSGTRESTLLPASLLVKMLGSCWLAGTPYHTPGSTCRHCWMPRSAR